MSIAFLPVVQRHVGAAGTVLQENAGFRDAGRGKPGRRGNLPEKGGLFLYSRKTFVQGGQRRLGDSLLMSGAA